MYFTAPPSKDHTKDFPPIGSAQNSINTVNITSGCQLFAKPPRATGEGCESITLGACTQHQEVPVGRDTSAPLQAGPSGGCANSWHPLKIWTENYHCIMPFGPILIGEINILASYIPLERIQHRLARDVSTNIKHVSHLCYTI